MRVVADGQVVGVSVTGQGLGVERDDLRFEVGIGRVSGSEFDPKLAGGGLEAVAEDLSAGLKAVVNEEDPSSLKLRGNGPGEATQGELLLGQLRDGREPAFSAEVEELDATAFTFCDQALVLGVDLADFSGE